MKRRRSKLDKKKLKKVKLLALDVDGVLTDGKITYTNKGEELRTFSFLDIMGLSLARRHGLHIAVVSGEQNAVIDRLMAKLGIKEVHQNCKDKLSAIEKVCETYRISLEETCFIGDDVNDLPVLKRVGIAVTTPNASSRVLSEIPCRTRHPGGEGAVREVVDRILGAHTQLRPTGGILEKRFQSSKRTKR